MLWLLVGAVAVGRQGTTLVRVVVVLGGIAPMLRVSLLVVGLWLSRL